MNIFATSSDPIECAKFLDDKRCVKMCLETAQILSTVLHLRGHGGPYKPTHIHHPAVQWAAASRKNYQWTLQHFVALCDEYQARYHKVHKCKGLLKDFVLLGQQATFPDWKQTPFVNCAANASLGISYKDIEDVHTAYKLYLSDRWDTDKRTPTWHGSPSHRDKVTGESK